MTNAVYGACVYNSSIIYNLDTDDAKLLYFFSSISCYHNLFFYHYAIRKI